ncbi:hypothetical protein F3I62_18805 [Pseudomonas sp. R-28-1W-6]|uniref:hypothetical protein n=1 Tax=Pseudomonas sp. R-28-1W-6 TaxID=2650101 RepID=UPI0013664256|nr:hypothetical protein [Pseudomonas sp. R-28-1W-6]MWV14155.1 hypothetical protein [Pseudomonas sp. R-28-1W-6]
MAKPISNPLFQSRTEILSELNDIESADLRQFFVRESEKIHGDIEGDSGTGKRTGNPYLDKVGVSSDSVLPDKYSRTRTKSEHSPAFPDDMPLRNLLLRKDVNGAWKDPNSIDPFNRFWKVFSQNDDNKNHNEEYKDRFFQSIGSEAYPRSMSEISVRLMNVLDEELSLKLLDMDSLKRFSNKNLTYDDISRGIKSGAIKQDEINAAYECAAHPGIHSRLKTIYISALNHRLGDYFEKRVESGKYDASYSDLKKIAYACQKYALDQARLSIKHERELIKCQNYFIDATSKVIHEAMVDRSLAGQKTYSQYGRTVRFDPKKPMQDQLKAIRDAYPAWVSKRLDNLVSKGLVPSAAAAIAAKNGRIHATAEDVKAALKAIESARKNVGEFSSTKDFLTRLSGSDAIGKQLSSYLNSAATARQSLLAGVEGLATKLATYQRGQMPNSSGTTSSRARTNFDDRMMGQAVAATAILQAGNKLPSLKIINQSLSEFGLSVSAAKQQVKQAKVLDQGLAVRLGKAEARGKGTVKQDLALRDQLGAQQSGNVLKAKKSPDSSRMESIDRHLAERGVALRKEVIKQESTAKPEAPKPADDPDKKGPKI